MFHWNAKSQTSICKYHNHYHQPYQTVGNTESHYDGTLSITLRTLVTSIGLGSMAVVAPSIQRVGGFGSTFGDGGSLNLAPAYAKS
jgi:hypothetical protein